MARIGYVREGVLDQSLDDQRRQLQEVGCLRIFEETHASDQLVNQTQRDALLAFLRPGDRVVITKLSCIARSLTELLEIVESITGKGAHLQSLREEIDTSNEMGRLLIPILKMLAEFRRRRNRENTLEGLDIARAEGRVGGRPPRFDAKDREVIMNLRREGQSLRRIAKLFDVAPGTVINAIKMETLAESEEKERENANDS